MARSSVYHRLLFLVLLTGFFFSVTFAEIRVYDMNSNIFNNKSILFIDSFQFTNGGKGGRIEINVSDIYLSNSNLNLNFSTVGFFLFTRYDDYSIIEKSIAGFTFHKLINGTKNFDFVFSNEDKKEKQQQELYSLYFINYLSNKEFQFSMVVKSSMYDLEFDKRNYLSGTKVLLPRIHFVFLMIYMCLIFFSLWNIHVYYIKLKGNQLLRIHIAILVVLIIKVLSHLTGLVRNIFIKHFGYSQGFFVTTLAYGGVVFSEVPFAILLTLVSCGWSYLKPSLNFKQKIILIFVIIFHSAMNVDVLKYTQIRPNCESCPSCLSYWWFSRALFDVAVLSYCVHSSYYFLLDSGDVEGKALPTLVKIKKLWKFFYLCWSFHSIKFFCLLFQYDPNLWETVLFGEAITFGLFVFVEYMFWSDIPSLKLRIDDDLENAAAKILNREYNISLF